jgi:hypothetical protein
LVDNIKMDLTEIGWDGMNWIYLLRIATRRHCIEPSGSITAGKFLSSDTIGGSSRSAQLHE